MFFFLSDSTRTASTPHGSPRVGDDGYTYIVILAEAEEAADLGGTLGSEALGVDGVGEAGDLSLALLDDGESEDRQIGANDGTTNGLALALTGSAGAVAGVSVVEEKADTGRMKDALPVQRPMLAVFNSSNPAENWRGEIPRTSWGNPACRFHR